MIQTLPCPGCNRSLVLVGEVSLEAILRCASCGDRFILREIIESRLGYWEVISDPDMAAIPLRPSSAAPAFEELEGQQAVELGNDQGSVARTHDNAGMPHQEKKVDWSKFEPIGPARNDRRRRKSSLASLVPVILGGFASVPVALLLIWYLLGTDPLQLAPTVTRYFPWIVPTKMRPYEGDERLPLTLVPRTGASGFHRFDDVAEANPSAFGSGEIEARGGANGQSLVTTASTHLITEKSVLGLLQPAPAFEPNLGGVTSEASASAMLRVQSSLQEWHSRGDGRAQSSQIAKELYTELTKLAALAKQASRHQFQSRDLTHMAESILKQNDLRDLVNQGARYWFEKRVSAEVELAVCCEITDSQTVDDLTSLLAISITGNKKLSVHLRLDNAGNQPEIGEQIFVLGSARSSSGNGEPPTNPKDSTLEIDLEPHFLVNIRLNE